MRRIFRGIKEAKSASLPLKQKMGILKTFILRGEESKW